MFHRRTPCLPPSGSLVAVQRARPLKPRSSSTKPGSCGMPCTRLPSLLSPAWSVCRSALGCSSRLAVHCWVPKAAEPSIRSLSVLIRQALRQQGIVEVSGVVKAANVSEEVATLVIDSDRRLHRSDGVVWVSRDIRTHLLPRSLDRMLAVGPQTLEDLGDGLHRAWRYNPWAQVPTPERLRQYLESQPYYGLDGNRARLLGDGSVAIGRADRAIASAFAEAGTQALTTQELRAALVTAGLSPAGASSLIATSPLLRPVAGHRYRLRAA